MFTTSRRFLPLPCISLAFLVTLLFLAGCGGPSTMQTNQASSINQTAIVLNLDMDRYEFNTLANMCKAPVVADVVVGSFEQSHWNTTNRAQPSFLSKSMTTRQIKTALMNGGYTIYTPVKFTNMSIISDRRTSKQPPEEFVMFGGQQGTTRIMSNDFPQLKVSTRYLVVFAPGLNATTHSLTWQWLEAYNAFPIDAQGMVTLQQAGSPNEPGPGKPQPEVKISLTALQQQLASCH